MIDISESMTLTDNIFGDVLTNLMCSNMPLLVGRIGGGDYDLLCRYLHNSNSLKMSSYEVRIAKCLNGFFSKDGSIEDLVQYITHYKNGLAESDLITVGNASTIDYYLSPKLEKTPMPVSAGYQFISNLELLGPLTPYQFIEDLRPFMDCFKIFAEEKKVLLVTPFDKSYKHQAERISDLHLDYVFPPFELSVYKTPVTYNESYDELKGRTHTDSWGLEVEYMCEEISHLDFDIALLSCGSYAMPIGAYIKTCLEKQAIYVGGVLQPMFNITSSRYSKYNWSNITLNPDTQITILEKNDYDWCLGGRSVSGEALLAYL